MRYTDNQVKYWTISQASYACVFDFQALFSTYSVDWDGPLPSDGATDMTVTVVVHVLVTDCSLSQSEVAELNSHYNPLNSNDNFTVDMYVDACARIHNTQINFIINQLFYLSISMEMFILENLFVCNGHHAFYLNSVNCIEELI